jgi:ankyrin repeat protein
MVRRLLKVGADANQPDAHGWTPLVAAAASEDTATVLALLDADANPGYKSSDGRRAVDLVSANEELWKLLGAVKK